MQLIFTKDEIAAMGQEVKYEKAFDGTPITIKGLMCDFDKPGHWSTYIIAVYRDGELLGGYRRMYHSFGADTFAPFQWKGQWYALYSADYTALRAMRLHESSLEDWCGEEGSSYDFCPVNIYLPQHFEMDYDHYIVYEFDNGGDYKSYQDFVKDADETGGPVQFSGFGFYCGCVWGDDSDWKLRYIDYSRIDEKVLILDDRFGYHPLPDWPLKECVDMSNWTPKHPLIVTVQRTFTVARAPQKSADEPSA